MKKKKSIFIIFFLIVSISVVLSFFLKPKAYEVEVAKVSRGTFVEEIFADGFFRAKKRYTVTAFADGDIKRVDFKAGDVLNKNQTITELYWDIGYKPVPSPLNGVVTKVFRESAGPIRRGDPIIELIDPTELEIVAELLTTDALRVKVGNSAYATGWGEGKSISAEVVKISKAGFNKISALGVEEERTEVIMEPKNLVAADKRKLGHMFHTQVAIQINKMNSVLKIPVGALMRTGSTWAVYVVKDGKAHLRPVTISLRGNEEVAIADGLKEDDAIINYPGDLVKDGSLVKAKK